MSDEKSVLPSDHFSTRLRELADNPGAVRASSTIQRQDFYGRHESWIVDTFRKDGSEEIFLQRINASETPIRLYIPADVVAAIVRQRGRATKVVRRRGARQAMAVRRERGDRIGNPEALAKARRRRAKKGGAK